MNVPDDLRELLSLGGDPYPDLPTIPPRDLRNGDVLLMLGEGWPKIHGIPIPISWLIRKLDGGAYSHAALVTWENGEPCAWDHSMDWKLGPVRLADALKEHQYCHVYRFEKNGEPLDGPDYPSGPAVTALRRHGNDAYDTYLLVLAGVVAVLSRMPESATLRFALRMALNALVELLEWLIGEDIRRPALVCTGVVGVTFWEALFRTDNAYAIEVDLERRRLAPLARDPKWEEVLSRIRRLLARIWPDFEKQWSAYQAALASNQKWVPVGGPGLPVNLVAPSDLEHSRTLRRTAKLAIPAPQDAGAGSA